MCIVIRWRAKTMMKQWAPWENHLLGIGSSLKKNRHWILIDKLCWDLTRFCVKFGEENRFKNNETMGWKIISLALVPCWKKNQHWILIDKLCCDLTRFCVIFRKNLDYWGKYASFLCSKKTMNRIRKWSIMPKLKFAEFSLQHR